jgi:hypothetical protein
LGEQVQAPRRAIKGKKRFDFYMYAEFQMPLSQSSSGFFVPGTLRKNVILLSDFVG